MQNKCKNFGTKYVLLRIRQTLNNKEYAKDSMILIYNVESNMIKFRTQDENPTDYWITLQDYICRRSEPWVQCGRPLHGPIANCYQRVTEEEKKEIEEDLKKLSYEDFHIIEDGYKLKKIEV